MSVCEIIGNKDGAFGWLFFVLFWFYISVKIDILAIFKSNGKKETIDTLLAGIDNDVWTRSLSNEWGRLAQGNKYGVSSTDTIYFINEYEVPIGRNARYVTYVLDYRPLKDKQSRVRITVGGDRLIYLGDAGSPAANLMETNF